MKWYVILVVAFGSMAAAGCGGDDDDGNGNGSPAQAQCEDFGRTWCQKAMGCLVTLGTLPAEQEAASVDQCGDVANAAAQCDRAVSVGASYAQCLSNINDMQCSAWDVPLSEIGTVRPPSSCTGVILIQ